MPSNEKLKLPVDSDTEDLVNGLLGVIDKKRARNVMRQKLYDAKNFNRLFRGGVVPVAYQNLGIVLGWSAKAVDMLARRCNLETFVWPDGDLDSIGHQDFWDDNSLGSEFNQGAISGLMHASTFIVNSTGTDKDEPPAYMHFVDALNATGTWSPRRRRLINGITIENRDDKGNPTSLTLYEYGKTTGFELDDGEWVADIEEHGFGMLMDLMPYKPRQARPFGMSRISRASIDIQNRAVRTCIRMEGHMDVYSFPEFWMLGADSSIFKDKDGNLLPEWKVMLGRIKGIPDDDEAENPRADVKQFPGSDPEPHLKALKQQAQFYSGETSIPLTSLGVSDMTNPTSADSYIASREDLIAEAEGTTDDWSPALRRRYITGLAMYNGLKSLDEIPDEWKTIQPKWRSPIYLSRAAQADAGLKQLQAAPWIAQDAPEVACELLGLDEQQITRVLSGRRRNQGRSVLDALRQQAALANQPEGAENADNGVPAE